MIRRILVGLAGTPYTSVSIRTAVELAARHGAELTGVTVLDIKQLENIGAIPIGAGEAAHELREHRLSVSRERVEQDIESFISACKGASVRYDVKREEAQAPFDFMISLSRYHDMMVFGLRSIFEYEIVGDPVSDPSLLLIRMITEGVRPIVAVGRDYRPIRRVMISYSGSIESAKTMKRFVQLRPWPGVEVRIVTFQQDAKLGDALLADAAAYCRAHGIEPQTEQIELPPEQNLLPTAEAWDADLVVLGNSAKSLLLRRIFGETALHSIRHAECPLFLGQ